MSDEEKLKAVLILYETLRLDRSEKQETVIRLSCKNKQLITEALWFMKTDLKGKIIHDRGADGAEMIEQIQREVLSYRKERKNE
jgi:hypothetical protein